MIAVRPKTGELVWAYQYIPNESYDFDGTAEPVLADLTIDGRPRKVILNANKNGFMYVIDRTNGKLIAAHPFVKVNWASHIDLQSGRPVLTDIYDRALKGETVEIWPSRGQNATLPAFNPKTGLIYVNSWEISRIMKYTKVDFVMGQGSTGVDTSFRYAARRRAMGLSHGVRSADRQSRVEGAGDRHRAVRRHAFDRRRLAVHRPPQRRLHRARSGNRRDAVEVQDDLRHQRRRRSLTPTTASNM